MEGYEIEVNQNYKDSRNENVVDNNNSTSDKSEINEYSDDDAMNEYKTDKDQSDNILNDTDEDDPNILTSREL